MVPQPSPEFAKYQLPAVAVDIIIFAVTPTDLQIGLITRNDEPFKGKYALPGRFVRYDEPIETTAATILKDKANIEPEAVYLEQLYTFGQSMDRDTRIRTISVVYYCVLNIGKIDLKNTAKLTWLSVANLPQLAFDHNKIIELSLERFRNKIVWSNIAPRIMPEKFTLTELQIVHEVILDKKLDKRNFRKKVLEDEHLVNTNEQRQEGVHRPAYLYTYANR